MYMYIILNKEKTQAKINRNRMSISEVKLTHEFSKKYRNFFKKSLEIEVISNSQFSAY